MKSFFLNSCLVFFMGLWFFDPSNKLTIVYSLLYLAFLYARSKNLGLSLSVMLIISGVIFTGKTHYIQLLDLRGFSMLKREYPTLAYFARVVISYIDIFSFLSSAFLIYKLKKGLFPKIDLFGLLLIIYLCWSIISNIAASPNIVVSLYYSLFILYALILHFVLGTIRDKKNAFGDILQVLSGIIIFESFITVQQFLNFSTIGKGIESLPTLPAFGDTIDEYFAFRPVGTFVHANNLSIYTASVLVLILGYYLVKKNKSFLIAFLFGLVTFVLTLSRTAWMGLYISLLFLFYQIEYKMKVVIWPHFKKYIFAVIPILFIVMVYAGPRIAKSIYLFEPSGGGYLRVEQAKAIMELFRESPIFGVGTEMSLVRGVEQKYNVFISFPEKIHNFFLLEMAEKGIVNSFIFIALITAFYTGLAGKIKTATKPKKIILYSIMGASFITVGSVFFQPFFFLNLVVIYYFLYNNA